MERGSRRWRTSVKAGLVICPSFVTLPHAFPPLIVTPFIGGADGLLITDSGSVIIRAYMYTDVDRET